MNASNFEKPFVQLFAAGDVTGASSWLKDNAKHAAHQGYQAHPLLVCCVESNDGHCYRKPHLQIADLLIDSRVLDFRNALLRDDTTEIAKRIEADPLLVHAAFTFERGIGQPIHYFQSVEVGELLLNAGADIEAMNTLGESPLAMQLRFGTLDNIRFLLERGAAPNEARCMIPTDRLDDTIQALLEYEWDINRGSMLHDANHGHGRRVATWLRHGANPNVSNEFGQTALHMFAAKGIGRDAIVALVEAGADLNAKDADGKTPIDLARLAPKRAAEEILTELSQTAS